MTRWLRLGLRLSIGSGRSGLVRPVLMGSASAVGTLMVFAALGATSVEAAQRTAELTRTPVYAEPTPGSEPAHERDGLRLAERYDAIGTRMLTRVAVAGATADSPHPPGMATYPGPGEAVVSPALAELIRTDERARDRFPQRIVGEIAPPGLIAPDELYAYVGVPADDPFIGGPPVVGFRDGTVPWTVGPEIGDAFTVGRMAALAFALFVLVPFGVFLATCARLSASTRDRRIAALRLLGVSGRQAALVNAVETGVVAAVGALLGYAAFRLLVPVSESWHIGRLHWWAKDISIAPAAVALIIALVVSYAVLVGVVATRRARLTPLAVRKQAAPRRPTLWRLVPLLVGLVLSIVASQVDVGGGPGEAGADPRVFAIRAWLFLGGMAVAGLGLPLALGLLGWAVAGLSSRLPRTPLSWELAAARLRHAPGVAPRLVGALAVALYVVGMGSLGAAAVGERLDFRINAWFAEHQVGSQDPALLDEIRRVPDVEVANIESAGSTVNGEYRGVLLADCADIAVLYVMEPATACEDGRVYRLRMDFDYAQIIDPGTRVATDDGWSVIAPEPLLTLSLRHYVGHSAGVLVTRQAPEAAGLDISSSTAFAIIPDPATADLVARLVSARTPANNLTGNHGYERGLDAPLLSTLLTLGLVVSLALGVATFVVAAIDRRVERRREATALVVVGAGPRVVATSELGFTLLPLVLGLVTAVGATGVMAACMAWLLDVDTGSTMEVVAPILGLGAVTLAVGLVLLTAAAASTPRASAAALRRS